MGRPSRAGGGHLDVVGRAEAALAKVTDGNEPTVTARDWRLYQPFAIVIVQLESGMRGAIRGGERG